MNKIAFLRSFYKYHIYVFIPLIFVGSIFLGLGTALLVAIFVPLVSFGSFLVLVSLLTFLAMLFNRVAFLETLDAFRYFGTKVEKNPVARYMFHKYGDRVWRFFPFALVAMSVAFFPIFYLEFGGWWYFNYTILLFPWFMMMYALGFDALNDVLANNTMRYLMQHDQNGWLFFKILPHEVKKK